MKVQKRWVSGAAVAAMVAVVVPLAARAGATDTPAFEPDANAQGSVAFYSSTGAQVTSGSDLSHLFDYAAASSAGRAGATKATLSFAFPDHTQPNSSLWFSTPASASTNFPNTGAPAPVGGLTTPVVTLDPTDADLSGVLGTTTLDTAPGYANYVQVRVKDSGPNLPQQSSPFWESDILINQTTGTWQEVYPTNPGGLLVTSTLPNPSLGAAYKGAVTASGGDGKYVWSLASGALPTGLKLATTGKITGKTKVLGTYTFTVAVKDKSVPPVTGGKTFTLTVQGLTITTPSLPNGTVGVAYKAKLAATGFVGAKKWVVSSGTLPPGLKMTAAGVFSGKPTTAGSYLFTVSVTDHNKPTPQTASQSYNVTIS
jgi:hypothetical protein